ncbi:MAG: electron transport complex subunit RsxD [Aestuariibacter sp.]
MQFTLASSPHQRKKRKTSDIMLLVMLLAIPGVLTQVYFFGIGTLIHIALAAITAIVAEASMLELRKKNIELAIKDNTALLTAFLLAIAIPPFAPWWIPVIGTLFAIVIVKQLYGGLGFNLFNPAMAAYVLLLISFPVQMTSWSAPFGSSEINQTAADAWTVIFTGFSTEGYSVEQLRTGVDGYTMATPLDGVKTALKNAMTAGEAMNAQMMISNGIFSGLGIGWAWVNLAYLIGGILLIQMRVINWHLPVSMLAGLALSAALFALFDGDRFPGPMFHLFSGATMLGAFFIITDPVTAATSNKGRLIFGFSIGVLTYIIRTWGGYPDAVAFAVLLLNMAVPVIDQLTKPRTYGHQKSRHGASPDA